MIFIGRAEVMVVRCRVQYIPLLVGTEFFAKTNQSDPMDLLTVTDSKSWKDGGGYSWNCLSKERRELLKPFTV